MAFTFEEGIRGDGCRETNVIWCRCIGMLKGDIKHGIRTDLVRPEYLAAWNGCTCDCL